MKPDTTSFPVRVFRISRVAAHLLRGAAVAGLIFPWIDQARRNAHIQRWSAHLLRILSIRLEVLGNIGAAQMPASVPDQPLMLVANHVSWLDIFAINAARPVRFVAKSEVRSWPLIGWLSEQTGTLFIQRARRHHAAQINDVVVEGLRRGDVFTIFPEGTTTAGDVVLPFYASLLEPALTSQALLQPLALRYAHIGDDTVCHAADYTGDMSLVESLWRLVSQRVMRVQLHFLAPMPALGHRRELALAAQSAIASVLRLPVAARAPERSGDLPDTAP